MTVPDSFPARRLRSIRFRHRPLSNHAWCATTNLAHLTQRDRSTLILHKSHSTLMAKLQTCFCLVWCLVSSNLLIQQQWFANIFDLGNGAFQIECFREDDFEDL